MWLSSDWFIGLTDLEMKNHEPNRTRSVSIGSDRFQTEPNKVGYFFGLVRFGLSVSLVLSKPLTPLVLVGSNGKCGLRGLKQRGDEQSFHTSNMWMIHFVSGWGQWITIGLQRRC